jgi:hypothetical protein
VDTMFADRPVADETLNQSAKATSQDPLPVVLKAALAHVERADKAERTPPITAPPQAYASSN